MKDLKDKTVEELMKKVDLFSKDSFDELARRLEEARQRSEAHDAEVAAKALESFQRRFHMADRTRSVSGIVYEMVEEYRANGRKE